MGMKTIREIAEMLVNEHGCAMDAALTAATTYAIELGYSAPAGGQAPELTVTGLDAAVIRRAFAIAGEIEPSGGRDS
jgi:hypothetical protein